MQIAARIEGGDSVAFPGGSRHRQEAQRRRGVEAAGGHREVLACAGPPVFGAAERIAMTLEDRHHTLPATARSILTSMVPGIAISLGASVMSPSLAAAPDRVSRHSRTATMPGSLAM